MRFSQRARWSLAGGSLLLAPVLVSPVLIDACSSIIAGRPVAAPGAGPVEPTYPTPRPSPSTPAPTASPAPGLPTTPANPTAPAGAIPLPPDQNGYVFIETQSGTTRCQINKETVGCEAPFTNSPMQDGEHANGVSVDSGGRVQWVLGNLGAIPTSRSTTRPTTPRAGRSTPPPTAPALPTIHRPRHVRLASIT